MKYSPITFITITTLFLCCQFFGLLVINGYKNIALPYALAPPEIQGTDIVISVITGIIMMTIIFYLFSKLKYAKFLKVWFGFALVVCISISLSLFIGDVLALILAVVITILRIREYDLYVHNISEVLLYGGLAVLFTPLFNITTALMLLLVISIYDYISVFITKHMITLAKTEAKGNIFTGLIVKNGDEQAILGGGDIAFTLIFAAVLGNEKGLAYAFISVYLITLALITLIVLGKKGKFYPAMPILSVGCSISYLLSMVI